MSASPWEDSEEDSLTPFAYNEGYDNTGVTIVSTYTPPGSESYVDS
jgi:hypothetical protein